MKLTYWGHSSFLVETASHRIVIDPFLSGNEQAVVSPAEVECDCVIVTHGHPDHVGDSVEIAKRTGATVVANFELASFLEAQGATVHPMHIGGAHAFPFGRVKLTIAHHGSGHPDESGRIQYTGNPAGVLLTADNKTFYHAGDTGLFLDMQLIGELDRIDVAALPIGDNFTMGPADAARAVEFLKPGMALPMHYGTWEIIAVDPQDFAQRVEAAGFKAAVPAIGESFEV